MTVNDRDAITAYCAAVGRLGGRLAASVNRFLAAFQADPSDPATMTAITTETQEWRESRR